MTTLPARYATEEDIPGDPYHCAVRNLIRKEIPWARHISAGLRTIKVYDYRCPHNEDGKVGGCDDCPGRCLEWATPLSLVKAMKELDRTGTLPLFSSIQLREEEARVVLAAQEKQRKREAQRRYVAAVEAGSVKPRKRTEREKARAKRQRRKS